MTFYLTRWWGSRGIIKATGAEIVQGKYAAGPMPPRGRFFLIIGKDAFESRVDAVARVRKLAAKKLAGARKSIALLEKVVEHGPDGLIGKAGGAS